MELTFLVLGTIDAPPFADWEREVRAHSKAPRCPVLHRAISDATLNCFSYTVAGDKFDDDLAKIDIEV